MLMLLLSLSLAADGTPIAGVALGDLARNVPACVAKPGPADLDLDKGCVGGLCVGMPLSAFEAALGPTECSEAPLDSRFCDFDDFGLKVAADQDQAGLVHTIFLDENAARTADGLGLGSSVACFLDRFEDSTVNVKVDYEDGWLLWRTIHFRDPRLIVTIDRDGRASKLQLSGPSTLRTSRRTRPARTHRPE